MTERREANGVLLDVNILFALSWDAHVHHAAAHAGFSTVDRWCTTPVTESALVRLLLTPAVTGRSVTPREALGQLAALRGVAGWSFLPDTASFADPRIDVAVLAGRKQVTDLHLVDLAAAAGMRLATFDAHMVDSLAPDDRHLVDVWTT